MRTCAALSFPSVREGVSALLEVIGYEVVAVGSAEEAIDLVMDEVPALMLSDVTLPGMAGPDLVGHMRQRRPGPRVVLMSGYFEAGLQARAKKERWHFLQKPFEFVALSRRRRARSDRVLTKQWI